MNDLQFQTQYKRLREVHPHQFSAQEKMQTVWKFVNDMDEPWFRNLVDRIVMSSRGDKIDIGEAVAGERRARRSIAFAEEVSAAAQNWHGITEHGLSNVLKKYGAKDLLEAINKSRRGEV